MTATGSTPISPTADAVLNGILALTKWNASAIDFNFPTSSAYYPGNYGGANSEPTGFVAVSATFKTMVRDALALYSSVANLTFTEVAADAASNISIARTSQLGAGSSSSFSGYGYYPGSLARAGDVWFASSTDSVADAYPFALGRGTFRLVVHELGHAMGLKHPHETSNGNTTLMPSAFDFQDYTVMSYRVYQGGPTSSPSTEPFGRPQTLMMYDILALQTMYGANYSFNSGDTTYTWSTTTGQMFVNGVGGDIPGNGNVNANRIYMTLWDGGGNDTLNLANYAVALNVDLSPGGKSIFATAQLATVNTSTALKATGSVFNALLFNNDLRSLIENATGGSGDDRLSGNVGANALKGNGGVDTLIGLAGSDILDGGAGADYMLGGEGDDTYHVDDTFDLVDEGIAYAGFGFGGFDTIISHANWYWDYYLVAERIQIAEDALDPSGAGSTIIGSIFSSELVGNSKTNILFGRGGSDTYRAGDGIDFMSLSTLGLTDQNAYVGVNGSNTVVVEKRTSGPTSYDIVFEFESGKDKLDVSDYGYSSVNEVLARGVNDGAGNSYFVLGDGLDYLYLVGLTKAQLAAGDFIV